MAIKRQSIAFPDFAFDDPKLNGLMQFMRGLALEVQRMQQVLRSGSAGQVLEKASAADYDAGWKNQTNGLISSGENEGSGAQVYQSVSGSVLKFRTLIEGSNVTIVQSADTLTIAASLPGTPGTVTSVAIESSDLVVIGSPITSSGAFELEIDVNKVTYAKMQKTTADAVVLGRRTGEGPGNVEELNAADIATFVGGFGYPRQLGYAGIA